MNQNTTDKYREPREQSAQGAPEGDRYCPVNWLQRDVTVNMLLESMAEGVVVIDEDGRILMTNSRLYRMFGYDQDDVQGHQLDLLIPTRFMERHAEHVREFFNNPGKRSMGRGIELAGRKKNGEELPVEISLSALKTEAGQLGFAFVTDISVRKKIENELVERNKELDAFAQTLAHNISSTLTGMVGFSEMLVDPSVSLSERERQEFLKQIALSGWKVSHVVKELLFFASVRKEDVEIKKVDMSAVVRESIYRLRFLIEENEAQIIEPRSFLPALGYGPWVEEVWFNYLSNAIKYGGTPPVITIGSTETNNGYIQYWIRDRGKGIDPVLREAVFHEDNTERFSIIKGHGLGLPIVYSIIKKLDGYVSVDSSPGAGSEFSFYLKKV